MDLAAGEFEYFTKSGFNERNAMFSPDGRWIAYNSNESGEQQIYVKPFPGPGGKWQISTARAVQPRWSGDGQELYYRSWDGVMKVKVDGEGASLVVGNPEPVLTGGDWRSSFMGDWAMSPGAQSFVMLGNIVSPEGAQSDLRHANFVLNWFGELEALGARP